MTRFTTERNRLWNGPRVDRRGAPIATEIPAELVQRVEGFLGDLGVPLQCHRFGHSHDHDHDDTEADEDDVLAAIRREAGRLHERLAHDHDVFVVEVMGSTGSGKTAIVEHLIEAAPAAESIGVIAGDVAGEDDARRYRALGVEVANVNTGKECHLDPTLVEEALDSFDLGAIDTLYLENVGNMVCPADFPLGAEARVLVVSTTEGDDVVRKHPLLFQAADAAVINKTDIADAVGADVSRMVSDVDEVAPALPVFTTSVTDGTGLGDLQRFLSELRGAHHRAESAPGQDHEQGTGSGVLSDPGLDTK